MIKKFKVLLFVISFVFASLAFIPGVMASEQRFYTANSSCNVRKGPGTNYDIITSDGENVMVRNGQDLEYVNLKSGTVNGHDGQWYGVKLDYGAREYVGYVFSECVDTYTKTYNDDTTFENSISGFPESYKPYLRKLHALHPNWVFKADNTVLDWNESVNNESYVGASAVSSDYPSLFFRDATNPNGVVIDGDSWYAAAKEAVAYYLDARNLLNEKKIFQFQKLSYDNSEDAAVAGILSGTFMSGTFTENGVTKSYKDAFIEAAKASGVSATHLASRAVEEMGTTKSAAASGTVSGYEGYYNFYNIGASSGIDNYLKGLQYAKDHGWNGIQKAITGGAEFIGESYVLRGQDTIYYQKFNTASYHKKTVYAWQYMTNIMAPSSEASSIYSSYKDLGIIDNAFTFVIPVYSGMPASAFKVSRVDTIGVPDNNNNDTPTTTTKTDVVKTLSASEKITKAGYLLSDGYITRLGIGMNIDTFKNKIASLGGSVTAQGGNIATGSTIKVDDKTFTAVVYGDVSGDSSVTIKDLLFVQKYLLGDMTLNGANKKAADIDKNGAVTIKDLLLVQKYLLGDYSISQ